MPLNNNEDFNNEATQRLKINNPQSNSRPKDVYTSKNYSHCFFTNLKFLKDEERFCDVEIMVNNCEDVIKAHRIILSTSSPYFEAMFRPLGLSENKQEKITLHSITFEILQLLINFIYTGSIEINQVNVQELLAAADMLQISEVVIGCCEYLCRELHPSNALGILRFAEIHNCKTLQESALSFIYSNFIEISEEEEFLDIPQSLLIRLLSSETIRVDHEYQVFMAALKWITHKVEERRQFVFEILSNVRLALISVQLIDNSITDCHDCSLKVALRSIRKDLTSRRGQLVTLRVVPRLGAKKSIYIIGGSKRETTGNRNGGFTNDCIFESVIKYDLFRSEWIESAPMNVGRILPGVTTLFQKIFVVGGERGSQILANGEVYDPEKDVWESLPPMIVPRCEFGLCAVGGTLYAVGGWIGEDIGGSIERFDPIKSMWEMVGEMPEPRFSMGVVSFEGQIYVVGGCTTRSRHLPDLISYNPVTQEWTKLARMNVARCQMGVAVLGGYLYVVGGNSSHQDVLRSVERYSFDNDVWETVMSMSIPRASPCVAAVDGFLYVAGGDQTCEVNFYRAQITVSAFERYDPNTDSWENCPDLPTSRSEAGSVVL